MTKKIISLITLVSFVMCVFVTNNYAYGQLIENSNFDSVILPWKVIIDNPAKAKVSHQEGKCIINVLEQGENRWDVRLTYDNLKIKSGHKYTIKFSVTATNDAQIYPKIGDSGDPYYEDWNYKNKSWNPIQLTADRTFSLKEDFIATRTADNCELSFHIAGMHVPKGTYFEFDDIYLTGEEINENKVFFLGDLNKDGKVNSTDASLAERVLLDPTLLPLDIRIYDFNKDGKFTSTDISMINLVILGRIQRESVIIV